MKQLEQASARRLTKFYGELSSLEMVIGSLALEGVDTENLRASDVYTRGADCQNLGAFPMLEVLAAVAAEYGAPAPDDELLDIGCGLGGPGRFLIERFGCSVVGTDLVPKRIEIAKALTRRTGLDDRISYRRADATDLPFRNGKFAGAWMLDVSMHIRDKRGLFGEIARVLRPGGLLVMHEQLGPLPDAMRPVTRQAPYIAPSLPQLIRYVDDAGLRVLTWRDTTPRVVEYFEKIQSRLLAAVGGSTQEQGGPWREHGMAILNAYIETLSKLGGRTGILVAKRSEPAPRRARRAPPPKRAERFARGASSSRLLGLYSVVATLTLGYGSVFALLAEIRARFGFDDWAIGVIGGAGLAAGFVAQLFLSRFADRGHLRAMLGGGIAVALLGLAGMIAAERLWEFVAARVLLGLGTGCVGPAVRRVAVMRDPTRAGEALGIVGVFEIGGFLFGPVLASVLDRLWGLRAPFIALTVLLLAVAPLALDGGSADAR